MKSLKPLLLIHGASSLHNTNVNRGSNQQHIKQHKGPNNHSNQLRGSRTLQNSDILTSWSATDYHATHPFYPSHSSSTCLDSRVEAAPEWMTLQGGYAENHLFASQSECCDHWGFDGCSDSEGGRPTTMDATAASVESSLHNKQGDDHDNYESLPTIASQSTQDSNVHQAALMDATLSNNNPNAIHPAASTFPTMSCGSNFEEASQCTQLCLSGAGCPEGQSCFSTIPCPAELVAAAMGNSGQDILNLVGFGLASDKTLRNVCGSSYEDAESSCQDGYTDNFISCDEGAHQCPPDREICYSELICPLPPTSAPSRRPTSSPTANVVTNAPQQAIVANTVAVVDELNSGDDTMHFSVEEPIIRKDKTEIVGTPIVIANNPAPAPLVTPGNSNASPYTLDKSQLGSIAVAATSCTGGCPSGSTCVGNQAGGQLIKDEECSACSSGQTWWPCDVPGLCWCWIDGTDRIAPAPESGVEMVVTDPHYTVCDDILTREVFDVIAPDHQEPYSYTGLCDAILSYNAHHTEKAFGMGDAFQRAAELAAFLGNTLHESDEFRAGREYLMCADRKVVGDQVYCKPCDSGTFDWATFTCPQSLITGAKEFNEYCQPSSVPPEACNCGNGMGQTGDLEGHVPAKDLFFGRGAIQLSWNYNYIGASIALTGSPDTFCDNPDLVATEGKYAWGAGLFFWMEHSKEGTTCHTESLKNMDFGGTLNNVSSVSSSFHDNRFHSTDFDPFQHIYS
jgi:hypothetical protein